MGRHVLILSHPHRWGVHELHPWASWLGRRGRLMEAGGELALPVGKPQEA